MTTPTGSLDVQRAARESVATARTFLFVPAHSPDRFEKAVRSGADAVILDLEDGVPVPEKARARETLARHWSELASLGVPLVVRLNVEGSDAWSRDLAMLRTLGGVAAVMVPKASSVDGLRHVHMELDGTPILPLIESAAGLRAIDEIAGAPGIARLALGHLDFMADTGIACDDQELELIPLRFAVAMATRIANLPPAIDGVTAHINDAKRLREDAMRSRRLGFGGKLCIHPRQIAPVHLAFQPSAEEMAWARRVVEADSDKQGGAIQIDGRMVDPPVVLQARRMLARGELNR